MTDLYRKNLLTPPDSPAEDELTQTIYDRKHTRIERIVSTGQCSPPGFWYDQEEDEWVTVLTGRAKLRFKDNAGESTIDLQAGDHLLIEAHRQHRVDWTDPQSTTIWIAVFYDNRPDDA
ncbi:MAG: cupin domain-containing protein [Rhodopirellula sp. JB044]|uniref:cupin domain-containing protein n=1 Tax=Rhodopirellula sp. JB044 TaxID=3342844 RepID=UPI00370C739D